MLIIAYDFSNDLTRYRFSKFLKKFGRKIQYSVYEIKNSNRLLQNIIDEVELNYKKSFTGADSVLIFRVCEGCKKQIIRYGFSANEESEVLIFE